MLGNVKGEQGHRSHPTNVIPLLGNYLRTLMWQRKNTVCRDAFFFALADSSIVRQNQER
jgi:hypothetical protein